MKIRTVFTPRAATLACFIILAISHAVFLSHHLRNLEGFRTHFVPHAGTILNYFFAVSVFGTIPLGWLLVRLRKERNSVLAEVQSWLPVRTWIYFVFLAVVFSSAAHAVNLFQYAEDLTRSFFESNLLGCLDVWALLVLAAPSLSTNALSRPWRYLDVGLVNVIVTLLLTEGLVTVWATYATSHLPIDAISIEASVAQFRKKPHSRFFNFTLNSGGYHDTEFFRATEDDLVVGLLSDSFGLGVVPYAYNFATIAERHLQDALGDQYKRVAVHNFSIGGMDMPEYAFLLHTEILRTNPSYVVLCVFVGNDFYGMKTKPSRHEVFQYWRLWILTKRILTLWEERRKGGRILRIGEPLEADNAVADYIHDTRKEPPTFSEEDFLTIESIRVNIVNPQKPSTQRSYQRFFRYLAKFQSWLGERLIVVVIPDEFQVDDALYQRILATKPNPSEFKRYHPQELIRGFCEERGIFMLDLLPGIRKAHKEERVYHLRDTHWNARGNRIAGREIADFILTHPILGSVVQSEGEQFSR